MKILKYKKSRENIYIITTNTGEYHLYDDIIIKHELLLKKEIATPEFNKILHENNLLKAYYEALKLINTKLRTKNEIEKLLIKSGYEEDAINYTLKRLDKEGYLNSKIYIEAFVNDMLKLNTVGESKILNDLQKLGFSSTEIMPILETIDKTIYQTKITNYLTKKAKSNRKSILEFKRKTTQELQAKGFNKSDITKALETITLEENLDTVAKLIPKLYAKYHRKYDDYTTKQKIKNYLYQKGYQDINIDAYLN